VVGGWALCPWIIIASAAAFLNFMSAYAIFMAPMAGILFCDYWLVKKRKYDVPALYDPHGIYAYQYGTNWRAFVVTAVVIIPLLPGLIWKVAPAHVHISVGLQHLFSFNWLYGFVLSVTMYYALNFFFPDHNTLISKVVHGIPQVVEVGEGDVESDASSLGGSGKFLGVEKAREVGNTASI
jgi:NCS1 family nucleobase:cation symporter-1